MYVSALALFLKICQNPIVLSCNGCAGLGQHIKSKIHSKSQEHTVLCLKACASSVHLRYSRFHPAAYGMCGLPRLLNRRALTRGRDGQVVLLVEFSGKGATIAGDFKQILRFLRNLLAFEHRMFRSRVTGLPFFGVDSFLGIKKNRWHCT